MSKFCVIFTKNRTVFNGTESFLHQTESITQYQNFNPFSSNVPLLYPLKTSENLRFSDIFRGYRIGTLLENGLRIFQMKLSQRSPRIHFLKTFSNLKTLLTAFLRNMSLWKKDKLEWTSLLSLIKLKLKLWIGHEAETNSETST